jgi:hypothetical protein
MLGSATEDFGHACLVGTRKNVATNLNEDLTESMDSDELVLPWTHGANPSSPIRRSTLAPGHLLKRVQVLICEEMASTSNVLPRGPGLHHTIYITDPCVHRAIDGESIEPTSGGSSIAHVVANYTYDTSLLMSRIEEICLRLKPAVLYIETFSHLSPHLFKKIEASAVVNYSLYTLQKDLIARLFHAARALLAIKIVLPRDTEVGLRNI